MDVGMYKVVEYFVGIAVAQTKKSRIFALAFTQKPILKELITRVGYPKI